MLRAQTTQWGMESKTVGGKLNLRMGGVAMASPLCEAVLLGCVSELQNLSPAESRLKLQYPRLQNSSLEILLGCPNQVQVEKRQSGVRGAV